MYIDILDPCQHCFEGDCVVLRATKSTVQSNTEVRDESNKNVTGGSPQTELSVKVTLPLPSEDLVSFETHKQSNALVEWLAMLLLIILIVFSIYWDPQQMTRRGGE